jgi:environmental stress-induced protein Ves
MKITGAADNGKVLYTGPGYVSGVVMEFFDIRKMPVNLWRNGAGETREICCFPPATRDFNWRASIASIASNGEFSQFPGVDRVITLLEGGEVDLDGGNAFNHKLRRHQPFSFAGDMPAMTICLGSCPKSRISRTTLPTTRHIS